MSKKVKKIQPIYTEQLSDKCHLAVFTHNWQIEYPAYTYEEDKDMKYKVTSEKVDKYLSDLEKNLQLFQDLQKEKTAKPYDVEGLRDMLIRTKGTQPGVYLTDRFLIMKDEEDLKQVKEDVRKAKEIAGRVMADYKEYLEK